MFYFHRNGGWDLGWESAAYDGFLMLNPPGTAESSKRRQKIAGRLRTLSAEGAEGHFKNGRQGSLGNSGRLLSREFRRTAIPKPRRSLTVAPQS